ncbi:hypothetical protein BH24ACT5_BH24ACT5_10670 [soil metagenome]
MTLLRLLTRGMVAGAVAMTAMDALWYKRYRDGGGRDDFITWEFSSPATEFGDDAPAPARVGKFAADAIGIDLADSAVGMTNNVVHWATGVGWGKAATVANAVLPLSPLTVGIGTGVAAWGTSYAVLGQLGIYEPITAYDTDTLWNDLSPHLVFGTTLGLAMALTRGVRSLGR